MGMASGPELTLLSVKYGSSHWLLENAALCQALNPDFSYRWLVVNNDADLEFERVAHDFTLLPAVNRPVSRDRGSAHHGAALNSALERVRSRFLLVIDHDFYVVRPDWMREVIQHMLLRELAFFGSVWHPKWSYQYRDFPSVHFMLIDLQRVPLETLDFMPDIGGDAWDNFISSPRVPMPRSLRVLLQAGRFRDTGWRIKRRFAQSVSFECLTPYFDLVGESASGLQRFAQKFLAQRWSVSPTSEARVIAQSFLKLLSPSAHLSGWEEFFWRERPFAFHLRMVGRRGIDQSDQRVLDQVLKKSTK